VGGGFFRGARDWDSGSVPGILGDDDDRAWRVPQAGAGDRAEHTRRVTCRARIP
jgi:hypothetical protein